MSGGDISISFLFVDLGEGSQLCVELMAHGGRCW